MNIEITDLDMILQHLDITSLEPHDDYTSEFTYKDQKILYKYIKQLQQENKQLKEKVNKLEILIENLKLGVTLNQEQEDLLDKVLFSGDSNE